MKLHFAPGTISVAVSIALEEAGLAYDVQHVDFRTGEQTGAAYAAINPKGRVPALETDGMILTETGAILDYIATQAPDLLPADPLQAAKARSVMYYLASTMHVNHAHKMRGTRWADKPESHADMAAKVPETMTASARFIEDHALSGPYILGDVPGIADCYLYLVCTWLPGDGVDLAAFPKITRFIRMMEARPSVQTVRARGMLR